MEGINVLNSYELSQYIYHTNWIILIIGLIVTLIFSFFFFFMINKYTHKMMIGVSITITCCVTSFITALYFGFLLFARIKINILSKNKNYPKK